MKDLHERFRDHEFVAYAAPETIPLIAQRMKTLIDTGRRMTLVRRWLTSTTTPEIKVGLRLDTSMRNNFEVWTNSVASGVGVNCEPGINGFGLSATFWSCPDEEKAAGRWWAEGEKANTTQVRITGWGQGREDRIVITDYNEHGVGEEIVVAFDFVYTEDVVGEQIEVLSTLAGHDGGTWNPDSLNELGKQMRYYNEPLAAYLSRD